MNADAFAIGFVALLAVVFVGAIVALILRARAARDALRNRGAVAEGEIVRVLREPNGAYLVRYQFTPDGAPAPITRDEYIGYLVADVPEVGAKVRVRYDAKAPDRSLLARNGE